MKHIICLAIWIPIALLYGYVLGQTFLKNCIGFTEDSIQCSMTQCWLDQPKVQHGIQQEDEHRQ